MTSVWMLSAYAGDELTSPVTHPLHVGRICDRGNTSVVAGWSGGRDLFHGSMDALPSVLPFDWPSADSSTGGDIEVC